MLNLSRVAASARLYVFALLAVRLGAQAVSGNIVGTVFDPAGSVVSSARLSALNLGTQNKTEVASNAEGLFRFTNLPPGTYRISAQAAGFAESALDNVAVHLNETATANFHLVISATITTLQVVDAPAAIDTTGAQIGNNYSRTEIANLPVTGVGWGPLNVALLGSGVGTSGGLGVGTGPSVGGQRPRNNNFTVDGVDNNSKSATGPLVYVPNESTDQVSVLQNQFQPEFGHSSGGQFNLVVKSGTNSYHGTLYEYFINRKLSALDQSFANQGIYDQPRYDQSHLGANFGGPILRNKFFFFSSFEYSPVGRASTQGGQIFAPTAAGYDALAVQPGVNQTNLKVMRQYAQSNAATSDAPTISVGNVDVPTGIIPVIAPNYVNSYYGIGSVDYNISDRDQLRGRFIYNRQDSINNSATLPAFFTNDESRFYLATLSEYHTFSPRVLNELRLAYQRQNQRQPDGNFSFPGLNAFPNLVFSDLNLQLGPDERTPQTIQNNLYQVIDNVSVTAGSHTFKFGGEFRNYISPVQFVTRVRGDYRYSTAASYLLDDTPDLVGSRSFGTSTYYGNQKAAYSYAQDTWRIRPNLTLDLGLRYEYTTVPLGLQSQRLNKIASVPGLLTFNAPTADSTAFAPRVGLAWSPGKDGRTVLRAGFGTAYDVIFDNIGLLALPPQFISTADVTLGQGTAFLQNGGLTRLPAQSALAPSQARAITSAYIQNQKLPYAINYTLEAQHVFARDYTLSVRYLGTRGVHLISQQQLNRRSLVTASRNIPTYLAQPSFAQLQSLPLTVGQLRAPGSLDPAFANAGFTSTILSYTPQGYSSYNGLAAQLNRRFSNGLQAQVAYTWSHAIDNSTAEVASTLLTPRRAQNFADLSAEKATSMLDHRHRFTFSMLYETPWAKSSRNWMLRTLVGNWQVAPVYTYESPQMFTVQSVLDSNLNNDSAADRALVNPAGVEGTGSGVYGLDRQGRQIAATASAAQLANVVAYVALNPNAQYIQAGVGAYTTGGRNTQATRPINNVDLSLTKHFQIRERLRFDLGARASNLFNHAQFIPGNLNDIGEVNSAAAVVRNYTNPASPIFNRPEQVFSSNPRYLQLLARFSW